MTTLYKVTVTMERQEETLTDRRWAEGAPNHVNEAGDWGYTDQVIQVTTVERRIFEQTTEQLDLKAVIKAVNS